MGIRTFNQLYVLTILVPAHVPPPHPNQTLSYIDPILFYLDTYKQLIKMNVLIKNNNIAHIVKEHVVICILEKSIQETKSVFQYF